MTINAPSRSVRIVPALDGGLHSVPQATNAYTHGDEVTITGTDFGANSGVIQFVGGLTGHLETTNEGTDATFGSWTLDGNVQKVVTIDSSRGKCWRMNASGVNGALNAAVRFDYGQDIAEGTEVYVSWYSKAFLPAAGQWKLLRISDVNDISDHGSEIALFNWYGASNLVVVRPDSTATGPGSKTYYSMQYPDNAGTWTMQEVILKTSTQGVADGILRHNCRPTGTAGFLASGFTNSSGNLNQTAALIYNAVDRFRWFIFQNYLGNGFDKTDSPLETWLDDIYVQVGSYKRVMLANSADLSTATHFEIQKWSAWSNTSVTVELNTGKAGGLSGTYWLHVVTDQNTSLGYRQITVS